MCWCSVSLLGADGGGGMERLTTTDADIYTCFGPAHCLTRLGFFLSASSDPRQGRASARPMNEVIPRDDARRKRTFGVVRLRRTPDAENHGSKSTKGSQALQYASASAHRRPRPSQDIRRGIRRRGPGRSAGTSKCGRALRKSAG